MKIFLALMGLLFFVVPARAEGEAPDLSTPSAVLSAAFGGGGGGESAEAPVVAEGKVEDEAEVDEAESEQEKTDADPPAPEDAPVEVEALGGTEEFTADVQKELNELAKELGTRTVAETLDALKKEEAREAAWDDRSQRAADYALAQVQAGEWDAARAKEYLEGVDRAVAVERKEADLERREAAIQRQTVASVQDRIKAEFPKADMDAIARLAASGAKPEAIKAEAARTQKIVEQAEQSAVAAYLKSKGIDPKTLKDAEAPGSRATGGSAGEVKAQELVGQGLGKLFDMQTQ